MNPADPYGLIGQVLDGHFRVDKFVGEGGFSVVYKGHHVGLDEPIAIKCLKLPASIGSALVESFVRRFRDESRLHYRLSQGNLAIVRSIASGTTMSPSTSALVPYMVLEWLDGRSLAQDFEVRREKGLRGRPLAEVIKLLDSAAQALAYAHAQGVVHRDLNPGNFFLAETKQGTLTKVLDFGVAKVISDHALDMGPRAQTIGQIRIFAPAYGSPEQFDDAVGKVSPASDVYSFSLIALECLRDQAVREGEHIGEFAMMALDAGARPTPRNLGVPVGDAVEEVFARATAMKPTDRPADMGELWGMLKNAVQRDRESGRPPSANVVAPRSWKPRAPAAGQPPPSSEKPLAPNVSAPIVEVARPGSIAPPPVSPRAVSPIASAPAQPPRPSRPPGPRLPNQTVRMSSAPPHPGEPPRAGSVPPPAVTSGAAALGATPLTSTLMMENAPPRILTPVPATTRTGEPPNTSPMASPMAQSQHMTSTIAMGSGSHRAAPPAYGAPPGVPTPPPGMATPPPGQPATYSAPPSIVQRPLPPPPQVPNLPIPRSEIPTVVPPKPKANVPLALMLVAIALAVGVAGVIVVYRWFTS